MMISYAQNYEDVVLMRALGDIGQGFYIDVGALAPEFHSVTKAFYDRGWSGINIEPNPQCQSELMAHRPRDLNLGLAIGDKPGPLVLHVFADTGLSTFDASIAAGHIESGWRETHYEVEVLTLEQVWRRHVPDGHDVHFLKIDVEGFEHQAIVGNDWKRYRPWVVLVEATLPMTQSPSHMSWEPILLAADYRHAYSDGLNRFYVAAEHAELIAALAVPPNVFDEFKPVVQVRMERELSELSAERDSLRRELADSEPRSQIERRRADAAEAEVEQLGARVASLLEAAEALETRLHVMETQYELLRAEREAMLSSRCWRMTYPFRQMSQWLRLASPPFRSFARRLLTAVWTRAAGSPRFKAQVLRWMRQYPHFASVLNRFHARLTPPAIAADGALFDAFGRTRSDLSTEAREILDVMREAGKSPRKDR